MACFTCIGCGDEFHGPCKPAAWHTLVIEVENVGTSRNTAKIRVLNFCPPCMPCAQRFAEALCAREEAVPRAVTHDEATTLDDRPPFVMDAVPAMAR